MRVSMLATSSATSGASAIVSDFARLAIATSPLVRLANATHSSEFRRDQLEIRAKKMAQPGSPTAP
jgi:hypothetical protein